MATEIAVIMIAAGFATRNQILGRPYHSDERKHHDVNIVKGITARPSTLQMIATFAVSVSSSIAFNVSISKAR